MNLDIKLYHDDCFNVLDKLTPESVDLILTDPPFGILGGSKTIKNNTWDEMLPIDDMFNKASNPLKINGKMILFSYEPYTTKLRSNVPVCFDINTKAIWVKNHFSNPLLTKTTLAPYYEEINIFKKKYDTNCINKLREYSKRILNYIGKTYKQINRDYGHRKMEHFFYHSTSQFTILSQQLYDDLTNRYNLKNMDGYLTYEEMLDIYKTKNNKSTFNLPPGKNHKSNVFNYPKDRDNYHPTQKPVNLLIDLIETYSNEGDTVLDFTAGSGSTGVACLRTNRNFIGIEKNKEFFDIMVRRIEDEQKQIKIAL